MCATHFLKCVEVDGVARVLGLCNVEMCYPHARECMKADPVAVCGPETQPKDNSTYWYPPNCAVYGTGSISSLSIPLVLGVLIAFFFAL